MKGLFPPCPEHPPNSWLMCRDQGEKVRIGGEENLYLHLQNVRFIIFKHLEADFY